MLIFVWRGKDVLKNYRTGLVVVPAASIEDAWTRLKAQDIRAFYRLKYGIQSMLDSRDEEWLIGVDDFSADWKTPEPEIYTADTLPVLVLAGSE